MSDFLSTLHNKILLGDGAMGTMLVKEGLPPGENPELWMLSHPEKVQNITKAYLAAGSEVLQTNTFGANRLKLQEYHAAAKVREINLTATRLVRKVVGNKAFVAGIIGPTGYFPAPLSDYTWLQLMEVFREQAEALEAGGVDFLFLETFSDLGEARAALFAAKNYTSLPVACSLTYTNGRTLTGTDPATAAVVLEAMGADLLGANCSTGPQELLPIMEAYQKATRLPLLVEPNAGIPKLVNGQTVYCETPAKMAEYVPAFLRLGVRLIGACCGSTPTHLKTMGEKVPTFHEDAATPHVTSPVTENTSSGNNSLSLPTRLAGRTKVITLGTGILPRLIGERINPTARKAIAQAFRDHKWELILQESYEQVEKGAQLLDLNVGVPGLEQGELLVQGIHQLQMALDTPLVLDCTNPTALEKGLQEYQGKALINSVNGEEESLVTILPLAKKYGAAVLGLTLDENGIPEKAEDRLQIAKKIVKRAVALGIPKENVLIDCLVLTAAANPALSLETIKAIALVKKHLGVPCVLGLSNVSHGLPQRSWLNNTFLALALGAGLDAAIANPHDPKIGETLAAGALLTGRDPSAENYLLATGKTLELSSALNAKAGHDTGDPTINSQTISLTTLQTYILQGQKEPIVPLLEQLLAPKNLEPLTIINEGIIPPLEKIGDLFAQGKVFLPQLMLAGEAVKTAFSFLQTHFPTATGKSKGTIIIGTVKGDVHDIGKNIVKALLENHGYKVVDLGKNVPAEDFLQAAQKEKAQIIGLSALMTTTMVEMGKIITEIKKAQLPVQVMVGGAVVTAEYAQEIGADGYGKDAVEAVKVVRTLLQNTNIAPQ